MFKSDPFDPAFTMITKRLVFPKLLRPILPASDVAWLRILFTCVSNSSSFVLPVLFSNMPICTWLIRFLTSVFFFVITWIISSFVFWLEIKSLTPTLKAVDFIYSVTTFCRSSMNFADAMLPKSLQTLCSRPFVLAPRTLLSIWPRTYLPFWISITAFDVFASSSSLNALVLYFIDSGGIIWLRMSKFVIPPSFLISVNNWCSFTPLNIIRIFIASRGVNRMFGLVNWYDPSIESW